MEARFVWQGALSARRPAPVVEPLGLLLLPSALERFERAEHARRLLAIPRVVALEPPPMRVPGWMRDAIPARQVRRLKLPGEPRLIVLYDPAQYPLARGLCARYEHAELWYLSTHIGEAEGEERAELDQLAKARATASHDVTEPEGLAGAEEMLWIRLRALEIISHRPFVPGGRAERQ
jgi:hypothetical protein